ALLDQLAPDTDHAHLRERPPAPLRAEPRDARPVPLAVRQRPRVDHRLALGRDLDAAVLPLDEAVRDLDVGAQPDPELAGVARLAQAPLLLAQRAVIGRLEDEVERAPVVAD